jgi:uncharacterized protein YrrD
MAVTDNIRSIDSLIGMSIISRASGNKLGQVQDLVVDPIEGVLLGLAVKTPDGKTNVLDYGEIYNIGPDAVMVNGDESVSLAEDSALAGSPLAGKDLAGTKIITEGGKLLGQVANIFLHGAVPPLIIYEVRESLLDKLLGRALFIPASAGRAVSQGAERIVVPDTAMGIGADSLEALAANYIAPLVERESAARDGRSRAALGAFEEGTIEVKGFVEEPVINRRARVVEEVVINKDVAEHTESVRDTLRRTDVAVEELESGRVRATRSES